MKKATKIPKWKAGGYRILEINLGGKPVFRMVNGLIFGHFGIHRTGQYGFSVTHLPTGRQAAFGSSLGEAKQKAEKLETLDSINWSQTSPTYYEQLPGKVKVQIDKIRGFL